MRFFVHFYEFYFREKGQICEKRENFSTRKLVHLKYMTPLFEINRHIVIVYMTHLQLKMATLIILFWKFVALPINLIPFPST